GLRIRTPERRPPMRIGDRHLLPHVGDSASFLYVEHCRVEQHHAAIAIHDENGRTAVPCTGLLTASGPPGRPNDQSLTSTASSSFGTDDKAKKSMCCPHAR